LTVQTADGFGNISRPPLVIRYIDEGSIVVPGMSGKLYVTNSQHDVFSSRSSDSHAHILEYGASRLMDLEGAKTIQGVRKCNHRQPSC